MTTIFLTKLSIYLVLVSAHPNNTTDQSKVIDYLTNDSDVAVLKSIDNTDTQLTLN